MVTRDWHHLWGRLTLARTAALLLCAPAAPALAHPHVWIRAQSEIVFDERSQLAALRQLWVFDEAYSAFMTLGLDGSRDGQPDPGKLADLAESNLKSVAASGYFTNARANGKPVLFAPPRDAQLTFAEGRLRLAFVLPLATPMPPPKVMVLTVEDPTFFVSFSFEPGGEAIRLAGPKTGCALNINRPAQVAAEGKQIVADEVAASAGPTAAADYVTRAILACP